MPSSKKRKLVSDHEAVPKDQMEAAIPEASHTADDGNAEPATEQPAAGGPDTITVDKNAERQARFKALQARAVSLRILLLLFSFVLTI